MIDMHNIIQRNISPLSNRLSHRNAQTNIHKILIRIRQRHQLQRLVLRSLGCITCRICRHLIALVVKTGDGESSALSQAFSGAGIGAEAEVEGFEIEGFGAGGGGYLDVGVEGQLPELEEVDWGGGAGLVGF